MAKIIRAVKPNAGIRARYRRQIRTLVNEMQASVIWWLRAAYRKQEDEIVQDALPGRKLGKIVGRLFKYWLRRFQDRAEEIGKQFIDRTYEQTSSSYKQAFRKAGFTVKMDPGRVTNNVVDALIRENVNLIVNIPRRYFGEMQELVQRSIINGRDVGYLVDEIQKRYHKSLKQADFIARDQANKAVQAIKRTEGERLGVKVGIWVHVPGRYYIRHTHKAMNGKPFLISEGMYDSEVKRNVQPGELYLCQCTYRDFVPEFGDKITPEIQKLLDKTEKPTDPEKRGGIGRKGLLLKGNWHEQQ